MSVCELKHVTKTYGSGPARVDAVKDVSLAIQPGEFTVLRGPSGSGKTTLLNLVGCLDEPTAGEVLIDGRRTGGLGSRQLARLRADTIGFVFQSFNLMPVLTAVENVELAWQLAGRRDGARRAAVRLLAEVGLAGLEHRRPNQLSGGQQQRVAIARALVKQPVLVIADEPTANLDSESGSQVLDVMQELNESRGTTFLFSSHDPRVIERGARVITLTDGAVVEDRS
jgi:putative ABC transport system ATP-binding protein